MTLLYDRYNAMVTAAWPTGIIAKPTVFNYNKRNFRTPNSIGHEDGDTPILPATADTTAIDKNATASLHLFAKNTTDYEKLIEGNLNMFADDDEMWIANNQSRPDEREGFVHGVLSYGVSEYKQDTDWS